MGKSGKRLLAVLMAAAMFLTFIPILGTQTAFAKEPIAADAQGTTGNCKWSVEETGDGNPVTLFITAASNGRMGDYVYSSGDSNAPWLKYRDQIEAVEFENVVYIGKYALYGCKNIRELEIDGVSRIGESAFQACRGLESIRINGVDCVIEDEAFDECCGYDIKMDAVELNGVKSLGYQAFGAVESYDLLLGEGLESIGKRCFFDNETLMGVTIPRSCKSIGEEAFACCTDMEWAAVMNPSCTIGKDALDGKLKVIFGPAGSTAENYASSNSIPFKAIGKNETGTIDLSSGDPVKLDYPAEVTLNALMLDDWMKYRIENDVDYLDLDRDGTNDLIYFVDYSDGVSVLPLSERSVGREVKFTLYGSTLDDLESNGRPYYGTLVIKLEKLDNPMTVRPKTAIVRYSKLKGNTQTLKVSKVLTIKKAKGTTSFKKLSGNKKITINKNTGKVTVKKGLRRGTYKIKVRVTAAGNRSYEAGAKKVTFTIKVK